MLNPLVNMVFKDHIDVVKHVEEKYAVSIENMASELFSVLDSGGTLFWCGNGGSASDAQHISAELVGRFQVERKGLRSISLTADTALVTAVSNDYGYDNLFARQVEALMSADDALIGISTSGNSRNVVNALHAANRIGAKTLGLFGSDGGAAVNACELSVVVPTTNTARVQECHILIGHLICELIEAKLS